MEASIRVKTPDGVYEVLIAPGMLKNLSAQATERGLGGHVLIATNETLAGLYGEILLSCLPDARLSTVRDGEQFKTLETVSGLYEQWIEAGADRHSVVLAFGGGVVGDTAGFAAATYMRGVPLIQMPTSLLAMVDSSVGGKVGVDIPQGKNLVGAFKHPDRVLIDLDVLATLPAREWRCGMAEVLKHGLLADEGLLDTALHAPEKAAELVRRAIQVKVDVVEQDPYEHGVRAHLNLGHTFAHAFERVTNYAIPHGEAVGIGLRAAVLLSKRLGLCDSGLVQRVEDALAEVGLPVQSGGLAPEEVYEAMKTDKKWQRGESRFVLLRGMCQPEIVRGVAREDVLAVLDALR